MIKVETLTEEIRKTIGTPFHHAGRVSGPEGGLDCGGIIIVALRSLGYTINDKPHYDRRDGLRDMIHALKDNGFTQRKPGRKPKIIPGDLVLIRSSDMYHHLVYWTEDETIIHAWFTTGVNKVVETTMLPEWWIAIHSIWRFGGLEQWQEKQLEK